MDNSTDDGLRRRFWLFVHDRLEDAWHWVYYHKLARPLPEIVQSNIKYGWQYHVTYINGRDAAFSVPLPDENTEKNKEANDTDF